MTHPMRLVPLKETSDIPLAGRYPADTSGLSPTARQKELNVLIVSAHVGRTKTEKNGGRQ